jgi:hypothetical protein
MGGGLGGIDVNPIKTDRITAYIYKMGLKITALFFSQPSLVRGCGVESVIIILYFCCCLSTATAAAPSLFSPLTTASQLFAPFDYSSFLNVISRFVTKGKI